jgi:glycerophosphoryl diester phosphodiesterase
MFNPKEGKITNMPPIVVILIVLLALAAIIVALVFPGKKKNLDEFLKVKYAHRGLHNSERAENSISAMKAAVEAGFGIELDVRLSKDGVLMVFHDDTLDRVCGREGKVIDFTADELATFKLKGTDDGIPTFDEVLDVVGGKVPLLVEIKEDAGNSAVSSAAAERLKSYKGPYIVESFNPLSVKNASSILPDVACGFLSRHFTKEKETKNPLYFLLENLLINRVSNPSFIAYKHEDYYMPMLKLARLLGAKTVAWTVRSLEEEKAAYEHGFDAVIFENYIPEENN